VVEEEHVTIVGWPESKAKVEHHFSREVECPVAISFQKTPAYVKMVNSEDDPFHVSMAMRVTPTDTIPVCIRLCNPICADSDYTIGIVLFNRPFGSIRIRGRTKVTNCESKY